jgi:hypothetical protein
MKGKWKKMMEGPIEMKYEMGGVMMGRGANMKEEH